MKCAFKKSLDPMWRDKDTSIYGRKKTLSKVCIKNISNQVSFSTHSLPCWQMSQSFTYHLLFFLKSFVTSPLTNSGGNWKIFELVYLGEIKKSFNATFLARLNRKPLWCFKDFSGGTDIFKSPETKVILV